MEFKTGIYKVKRNISSENGTLKKGEVVWVKLDRIIGETPVFVANTPKELVTYLMEDYCEPYRLTKYLVGENESDVDIDSECEICFGAERVGDYLMFLQEETLEYESHMGEFKDSVISCDKKSRRIVNFWWYGSLVILFVFAVASILSIKTVSQVALAAFIMCLGFMLYIGFRIFVHDPKVKSSKLKELYGNIRGFSER